MATFAVILSEDIEEKGLHVIVQGLVVQKEFGQQAEILAVDLTHDSIHLKNGEIILAVNLICRWVEPLALGAMVFKDAPTLHVFETELADKQLRQHGIFLWVGGGVPGLDDVRAKFNHRWCPDAS